MDSFDYNYSLSTIDPWMFTSTIADSCYPHDAAFAGETESALTKALQQSLFSQSDVTPPISPSFFLNQTDSSPSPASTVTASCSGSGSVSGSDPETLGSKRCGSKSKSNIGVSIGKTTKRKSRASKRSMTTFIQADPANFRRMVQEVTGSKLPGTTAEKPERYRRQFIDEFQGLLPTLDTSAYLLEVNGNSRRIPAAGSTASANVCSKAPAMSRTKGKGVSAIDLYSLCSFPTLESSS